MDSTSASASASGDDPDGGAYLDEILPGILAGLKFISDPAAQLAILTELCDALSLSEDDDESLDDLPLDDAVKILIELAGKDGGNPDVILMAARALTYFLDLMPTSAKIMVRYGAVTVLCGPLMAIEYLDVAEQCLQALEKISRIQSVACLKAGVIMAVLSYIDFFEISVQRVALSTVTNVCKKIPEKYSYTVIDVIPTLCNLLQCEDRKLVESAANCLIRIVENFSQSSELLDELCKHGVVNQSLQLISPDCRMTLSETTYTGLIGLLVRLAARSLVAVRTLFEQNISSILGGILKSSDLSCCTPYSLLDDKSCDQIHVVLKLLNQLIPPVVRDEQDIQLVLGKEKIIVDQPKFLLQFAMDILPVSIQVVNSGANTYVCYGCVSIIENIFYFSTPAMLLELIKKANVSRLLAGLLSQKDRHVLISTLMVVEILMKKLPGVFLNSFIKEGVIHAIYALSEVEDCSQSMAQQSSHIGHTDYQMVARDPSSCLCYAFDSCSYPSSSETKTCRLQKHTLPTLAKCIKTTYFIESVNSKTGLPESLQKIKTSCATLKDNVNSSLTNYAQKEECLSLILDQVMRELKGGESMSTFEFVESGMVRSLVHYLSNGNYLQRSLDNYNLSDDYLTVLKRFRTFTCMSLSGQSWQDLPLTSLIQNLQSTLSSLDHFPVILSYAYEPKSICTDVPAKRFTTHPCLKVHFVIEEGEIDLCNYDDILTIEFSSSFIAIEEVLWPRVTKKKNKLQALAKGFRHQRKQSSPKVDSSTKPRELMTERTCNLSCTGKEQVESRLISASQSNEDAMPKLIFLLDGKQLDRSITLYQAILQDKISADADIIIRTTFWNEVHRVTFKTAKEPKPRDFQMSFATTQSSLLGDKVGLSWQKMSFFSSMLLAELPCKLEKSNPSYDILFMLRILEGLNRFSFQLLSYERSNAFAEGRTENFDDLKVTVPSVPQTEFISSKLTDKLVQQMRDPLALSPATMPSWCGHLMSACPFLFSFEARWKYFCLNVFGSSINQMQHLDRTNIGPINDRRSQSAALPRKKFKVNRSNILGSAAKMMASYARKKALIEIEYSGEVGTGLGPTLEFYTLVSQEFQKVGLGMWRGDQRSSTTKLYLKTSKVVSDSEFVSAPCGLFPRPWSKATNFSNGIKFSKVIKKFFLLGQLIARAIQDGRILDLPFPRAFYKLILAQELDIYDIQSFDPDLGRTLLEFQALVNRKSFLESNSGERSWGTFDLSFRNTRIEDLCLDFTLPGYPDYVFACSNNSKMVNINNLEEYVLLVVDATVRSGISRQLEAFKSGFNQVFPLKALQIFNEEEIERLLCGEQDTWALNALLDHINFDHGYTSSSPPAINFLEIIQELECHQHRAFLQFVTGAPRLPPGGLASLSPKLTIVCKHCSKDADMELPSVMTCANYLKLPPYSSKERMRERLLYAITEGQGSFHLS